MASYMGEDFLGGKFSNWVASLDMTSKKRRAAASKTLARFDPTSKTAKYRNVTRVGLVAGAVVGSLFIPGIGAAVLPALKSGAKAVGAKLIGRSGQTAGIQGYKDDYAQPVVNASTSLGAGEKKSSMALPILAGAGVLAGLLLI